MKVLIDASLSPDWVDFLRSVGHEVVHWSEVGPLNAPDHQLLEYARENGYLVFTHDLDFGAILASTGTSSPSVIQVRFQLPIPSAIGNAIRAALVQFEEELNQGALVSVDVVRARAHLLPLD